MCLCVCVCGVYFFVNTCYNWIVETYTTNNIKLIAVISTSTHDHIDSTPEEPVAISSPNYPENYPDFVGHASRLGSSPRDAFVELFVLDLELAFSCSDLHLLLIGDRGKPHYTVSIIIKLFGFEQSYSWVIKNSTQLFEETLT